MFLASMLLVLSVLVVVRAHDQREIDKKICVSLALSRSTDRAVLRASMQASLRAELDAEQRARIRAYFEPLLKVASPLKCVDGRLLES